MSEDTVRRPRCHEPWQQMVIDSNGVVAPCCYWGAYGNQGKPMGNLNETPLEEIWNGPAYRSLRENMAKGDLEAAGCAGCYAIAQGMTLGLEYDQEAEREGGNPTPYAQNLALLKQDVGEGRGEMRAKPTKISLTPSHHCNFRCAHCYQASERTLELGRPEANEEVLQLSPVLVKLVAGGGEPFVLPLWRRFLKTFDRGENPYLRFATTTNASFITPEIMDGLRKFKHHDLNVSMDGTGEVFEKVRVNGKWPQVLENLRKLRDLARETPGSTIGMSYAVMKANVKDLPNFIRHAAAEDVPFTMSPVTNMPVSESLQVFNDPVSEMEGWKSAFEEARRVMMDVWIPAHYKENIITLSDPVRDQWFHYLDMIEKVVPWDILETEHRRVRVRVHKWQIDYYTQQYGRDLVFVIAPLMNLTEGHRYYAFPDGESFEVSLPEGDYCFNVSSRWQCPEADPANAFSVRFNAQGGTDVRHLARLAPLEGAEVATSMERALNKGISLPQDGTATPLLLRALRSAAYRYAAWRARS